METGGNLFKVSKTLMIVWTIACIILLIFAISYVKSIAASEKGKAPWDRSLISEEARIEQATTQIGAIWFVGIVVLGIIALISKPSRTQESHLCSHCGKYYDGNPKFCPNCGQEVVSDHSSSSGGLKTSAPGLSQGAPAPSRSPSPSTSQIGVVSSETTTPTKQTRQCDICGEHVELRMLLSHLRAHQAEQKQT